MSDLRYPYNGKTVLITGGTGAIGSELVRQARQAGAEVYFTFNSHGEDARALMQQTGARDIFQIDFTADDPMALFKDALHTAQNGLHATTEVRKFNQIDHLIFAHGVELSGGLQKHTPEVIDNVMAANLTGPLKLTRGLILERLISPGGQIAFVGSIVADGNHDQLAYSASKSGLRGAVGSLSYDAQVIEQKLGVKLLEPTYVRTPMAERVLRILERRVVKPELLEEFKARIVVSPEYCASEILRMTADESYRGTHTIPENLGMDIHQIRERYFKS